MSPASSVAATLRPETRQQLAIEALSKTKPISHLAADYEVSRKFVYEQSVKAKLALNESFEPTTPDEQILFHLGAFCITPRKGKFHIETVETHLLNSCTVTQLLDAFGWTEYAGEAGLQPFINQ